MFTSVELYGFVIWFTSNSFGISTCRLFCFLLQESTQLLISLFTVKIVAFLYLNIRLSYKIQEKRNNFLFDRSWRLYMHLPVVLIFIWIQGRHVFLIPITLDNSYLYVTLFLSVNSCLCIQEVETTPAYPDIYFAVDDFDSTFDAVVRCIFMMRMSDR